MIFQLTFIVAFCLFQEESSTCPNNVKDMVVLHISNLLDNNFFAHPGHNTVHQRTFQNEDHNLLHKITLGSIKLLGML